MLNMKGEKLTEEVARMLRQEYLVTEGPADKRPGDDIRLSAGCSPLPLGQAQKISHNFDGINGNQSCLRYTVGTGSGTLRMPSGHCKIQLPAEKHDCAALVAVGGWLCTDVLIIGKFA